ncbi:unnamed protein product [Candidula unifasciata]|uniref:sphingomyelin phosphodiesterase n=1 Tax=Candidula unifasciata TaxID=100452 RepID=A0A8S3YDF4_9EUPU|nr:unnamed protein product [Candidula unifasciata]
MTVTLKILTLNCWALPFPVPCKNRRERVNAICDYLRNESFDIVILEEIWVKSDFQKLRDKLQMKLPFSHYFYSGTIGSGVCVFSRHLIAETIYHRFQLNGHPHKIFHGDWFCGKGVGLCKIHEEGLDINLYCTHLHAEYNAVQDEYEAHRLAQAFELSQFIRSTSVDCDAVILAGDLNIAPKSLGYKVVTHYAHLQDAWAEKENKVCDELAGTCDVPFNTYTGAEAKLRIPNGERIDYIMYSVKPNCKATVTDCQIGIGKIPDLNISYSDHEAVMATINISRVEENHPRKMRSALSKEVKDSLQETLQVLDKGVNQCLNEEKFFQVVVFLLSFILYFVNSYVDAESYNNIIVAFTLATAKLFLAFAVGFSVWTALILKRGEFHALIACKEDIMKLLGV